MATWDHMWIFQEERWSWARRCSRQPIASFGEELSPYGPDLRDKVEAAVRASPNGHSRVWVELPEHCDCLIVIWGIETSREVSLKYPFAPSEPFVSLETHKNLDAKWRRPLEVWSSFQGPRAPYGAAARLAYIPSHVSIGCILLTATGLQGIRRFVQICKEARTLANDGILQILCLHDHGLLPGKEYVLTRTAQMFGFTAMIGHADSGARGGANMVLLCEGERSR